MARENDIKILIEAIDETQKVFEGIKKRLREVEKEGDKTGRNLSRSFTSAFGSLRRSLLSIKSLITGVFAVGGISLFMKAVIDTTAQIENLRFRLRMLGEGEETFQRLYRWAKALPISTAQAIDMFAKLRAYGLNPTIKQMTILTDTVLAMGGSEEVLDRIGLALGQIYSRGKLAAQEMNQLANAGIPIREILAEGLGVSTQELEELLETGIDASTALEVIFRGLEARFGGTSKAFANTWYGLMARLKSAWEDFLRFVGEAGVFDIIGKGVESLVRYLESPQGGQKLREWARLVGEGMLLMVEYTLSAISSIISGFQLLGGVIDNLRLSFSFLKKEAQAFGLTWKFLKGELTKEEWKQAIRDLDTAFKLEVFESWIEDAERGSKAISGLAEDIKKLRLEYASLFNTVQSGVSPFKRTLPPPRRRKPITPIILKQEEKEEQPKVVIPPTGVQYPEEEGFPARSHIEEDIKALEQVKQKIEESQRVWRNLTKEFTVGAETIANSIRTVAYSMEYNLIQFFDFTSKKFLDWKNLILSVLHDIYIELLRVFVIKRMLGIGIGYLTGGGEGGVIASSVASLNRHLGGYIPKFHVGGLAKDEVLALLKKGEYVLSRDAVNQLGLANLNKLNRGLKGGGRSIINIQIQALDAKSFERMIRENPNAILQPVIMSLRKAGALRYEIMEGL